ncbi:septation ring formation regulator EzrA [Virgibacillus phasianinus]|uniref:Septation ring formation regulator EzrA n=1 Tax=Virgibacillus phasianinus TaxID=2017483 RepID=A0A220U5D8_9BACI|nr:septation ring formation regulator EzrA [Virgibacillus phasianinus]ASK62943.1 septation ring formation regulator EzrA [Virgibacillus phasianinus]
MAYIIGIVLVIIALIIVGLILRKRIYDVVDQQESWKMDIMNRNIASQISRIKNLNLSGETQEKFESWKEHWEYIVTKQLPNIEEHLFDAEEAADRYRFALAKKTLRKVETTLQQIEKDIEKMLEELEELISSEEKSRKEIAEIEPEVKGLRKKLSQTRYLYGKAEARFDVELDELEEDLDKYHDLTNSGNYLEAQQLVEGIKVQIEQLQVEMDEFPELYKACKDVLPSQLDDLISGIKDMKEDGYRIEHLGLEKEIRDYQQRLFDCVIAVEKGEVTVVKDTITEVDERIKDMYQLLENEAIAKSYIETKIPAYRQKLNALDLTFHNTKAEVESLRQAYYFENSDMEKYLTLEKTIANLKKQLDELTSEENDQAISHLQIREKLDDSLEQLESLTLQHEEFIKFINNLRKDELEAKEKLQEMKDKVYNTIRKLKKSNIPGVPSFIWSLLETTSQKNEQVLNALEAKPLDMTVVQHALVEADKSVEHVIEQTDFILEQAYLTEQVIQYANRYRSRYPLLAAKLAEAERLFRSYEYELSLEHAAKAIEEIEPGALKRIEERQQVLVK